MLKSEIVFFVSYCSASGYTYPVSVTRHITINTAKILAWFILSKYPLMEDKDTLVKAQIELQCLYNLC